MNTEKNPAFTVVINDEEQYAIWPSFKEIPLGWKAVGVSGSKEECVAYVERTWVDMRPKSVRTQTTSGQ